MSTRTPELDTEQLVLDANAVAGTLEEIFGRDVTASLAVCSGCGNTAALATLRAFTHAPGVVLRCSFCEQVVLRFTTMPDGVYLDLRGVSCIRLA
jgi:hypothetical protein